jgi:riboflavin biosynthesis pyrimidine reductase
MGTDWTARFEDVVRRKTREATAAKLPPLKTVELGAVDGLDAVGNEWTRQCFDGDFYFSKVTLDIPATGLVFVQSSDGNTGARNPSSLGGGETDKHLIYEGLSRVAADGVLAGAETIRGSRVIFSVWHPRFVELRAVMGLPRHPMQIVATLGGLKFDDTLLLNVPELPVIVISPAVWVAMMKEELARRPWIRAIAMGQPDDLSSAFRMLRSIGVARVSAIGGRTIARAMINAGLIQDLYLTTSPHPGGEPNTPLYPSPLRGDLVVKKQGTGPETGVVFEHLLLKQDI